MNKICIAAIVATAGIANAGLVDFELIQHGEVITNQYLAAEGLGMTADNFNRPFDLAIGFDTNLTNTADPDLEYPWANGNLVGVKLGKIMILAENNKDQNGNGLIDSPDDEGERPAGVFKMSFSTPIDSFGFDIVDVESDVDENTFIQFYWGELFVGQVRMSDIVDSNSAFYQSDVKLGDNSANRILPLMASDFGGVAFDQVHIKMGGSGGVDNFVYTNIPAPGAAALLGLAAFAARRKR